MIDFEESYNKVLGKITNLPRIKEMPPRLIEEDIAWRDEDLKRRKRIKAEVEKLC